MKHSKIKFSILFFFIFQLPFLQAQTQKGVLLKGKTISSEIAPGEKHQYKVNLDKNQFAFFKLMQKGVDLTITTYNAKGEKLENFDSPNGKYGPELFTIISNDNGAYIIEVAPYDEKEPLGNYQLKAEIIKPKAVSQNDQVDEIFAPWTNNETPGAAVAVVKDGAIIYKKGYGMANLEYDIPISPNSVFHIASISKQFTVFSILLLEKEGKLSLDDDIRKYIPEVADFGKTITLRHLASHTSGLRDQWNLLAMAGWRMDDIITREHILKLVSKQKELNFTPGDEYLYCNTGFTLLAEVVSRVSKMSFAAFTKATIFEPLKMNNTLFYDDHEKIVKNRAYSYQSTGTGFKKSVLNFANVGATSLFTTVEDLSLWSMNFSKATIGDVSIFNKMKTLAILNNGETFGGALGQFVGKYKGLNEIQHGGADAGYRAYLTRFPDQNFSVIVFSNAAEFNPVRIAYKVVDIYLKDDFIPEPEKEENPAAAISSGEMNAEEVKSFDKTAVKLSDYTGSFYSEELSTTYHLSVIDNKLIAKHLKSNDFEFEPIENDVFSTSAWFFRQAEFIRDHNNVITGLKASAGRVRNLYFQKMNVDNLRTVQTKVNDQAERALITKTLMDYIDGTANGEPERIANAFHSDLNLYTVAADSLMTRSGQKYISFFKEGKKNNRIGSIVSIDYENDAASAKIEIDMPGMKRIYTDYLLLLKIKGSWKIIHKSYTYVESPE